MKQVSQAVNILTRDYGFPQTSNLIEDGDELLEADV